MYICLFFKNKLDKHTQLLSCHVQFYITLIESLLLLFFFLVSVAPEPSLSWYRDDTLVDESDKYQAAKENLGTCHLEVRKLDFIDQVSIRECT